MKTSPVEGSGTAAPVDLSAAIEHWMADGIITAEQATRMRADLNEPLTVPPGGSPAPVPVPRTSRAALVTEALGYLGGVIILVALGLVVGHVWDQLSVGVRLALVGVVTVLLLVAGSLIPARLGVTGVRLRSVLWFASSAAFAAFLGLCASELAGWADETQAMFAALGAALYSTVLWWAHRHLLQQVAVFVPLLAGVGTGVSLLPDAGALPGLAVWGVSVAWLALAWVGSSRAARSERCWVRSGWWGPRPRWWARAGRPYAGPIEWRSARDRVRDSKTGGVGTNGTTGGIAQGRRLKGLGRSWPWAPGLWRRQAAARSWSQP